MRGRGDALTRHSSTSVAAMKIYILLALLGVALVEAKVYFQETFSSEGEYKCTVIVKCMGEFEREGEGPA